jgi:hypothetical protein
MGVGEKSSAFKSYHGKKISPAVNIGPAIHWHFSSKQWWAVPTLHFYLIQFYPFFVYCVFRKVVECYRGC